MNIPIFEWVSAGFTVTIFLFGIILLVIEDWRGFLLACLCFGLILLGLVGCISLVDIMFKLRILS